MAEEDKTEKTEPASPFKLQEARKKGSVAKSMEFNSFMAITAGLLFMLAVGERMVDDVVKLSHRMLADAGQLTFEVPTMFVWLMSVIGDWLEVLAPLAVIMMMVGIIATFIQTGPVFSFFPLKPDIQRINPVKGAKKLFSMKIIFDTIKSLIKISLFAAGIYFVMSGMIGPLMSLLQRSAQSAVPMFIKFAATLLFVVALVLLIIAVMDMLFVRWEYLKNLRMSKHEVKEEHKRREGDPQIKSKRRELQAQMRKRGGSVGKVPGSDVIVTNPTHFAVILKYDRENMQAPQVVGKGTGVMAQRIREAGYMHKVPVIENPPLARALYKQVKIDDFVPEEHFLAVARLLRQAYAMSQHKSHLLTA